jgi:chorismate mutase
LSGDDDPLIRRMREQVSDNDRALVEAMNRRLQLVAQMWDYKRSRGLEVIDPEREEWMLRYLSRANRGPLSQQGLEELFRTVLELTKEELTRLDGGADSPP